MEAPHKQTVLIVEDEAAAAMALGNTLEQEDFTVVIAANGEEGLKLALEKHPDIILADLKMPRMTGMQMIQELRKDAWGKTARVIILTNLSDLDTVQAAMKESAFHYLVKGDTSMAKVIETVRELLKMP